MNSYEKRKYTIEISNYVNKEKNKGTRFAVWGAGKRGSEFVLGFDPDRKLIDYIFDKDESKIGKKLLTGHVVVDYRKYAKKTDVVFIVMDSYYLETSSTLRRINANIGIVSLHNWIYGQLNADQQIAMLHSKFRKLRNARLCALDILFNPREDVLRHISSYANDVERIYLWDNSSDNNESLFNNVPYKDKLVYISKRKNYGLGIPVNEISNIGIRDGFDWMLTFDQDSTAGQGMVSSMKEYAESQFCDPNAAIVVPFVKEPVAPSNELNFQNGAPYVSYVLSAIQSGSMHRLSVLHELRLRGDFFVDNEDIEYCERVILNGYHIVRLNRTNLKHQQDTGDFAIKKLKSGAYFYIGKYSPARYYYIYRNLLYMAKIFAREDPERAKQFLISADEVPERIKGDINREANEFAIACAKRDFENGVLGEWNGK